MANKKIYTQEEFENIFYKKYKDRYVLLSRYNGNAKTIKVRHLSCGYEFEVNAGKAIQNKDICCPKCNKKYSKVIPFVNDLYTTNYDLCDLLTNKEDGHKYKGHSSQKVQFTCPYCGTVQEKSINHVASRGLSCIVCGNKSGSYAERFFANVLCQLGLDFEREFSPDWIKPQRYDFCFCVDDEKIIVEIDGRWHYSDNIMAGTTLEEQVLIDKRKEDIAIKHGYDVIRLDYNYKDASNRKDYFISSILNSKLNEFLEFDQVDFSICDKTAIFDTLVMDVAKSWLDGTRNVSDLSKIYKRGGGTIRQYLKIACDSDIIECTYDELKNINKQYYHHRARRVGKHDDEIISIWTSGVYNFF